MSSARSCADKSIRDIVAGDSGVVVRDLKPVWLMSPLSVSDTLPMRTDEFDVVIFDEASQVPLEEAIPAIFRATQTIVVGDEMQLPPTDFFSAKSDADEEGLLLSENGQVCEYDLSSNSLLNHATKNLSARMLGWHYRSRAESLISFSNWAFYDGKLLTVPEQRQMLGAKDEILVGSADDGIANVVRLLDRPVSFHFLAKVFTTIVGIAPKPATWPTWCGGYSPRSIARPSALSPFPRPSNPKLKRPCRAWRSQTKLSPSAWKRNTNAKLTDSSLAC